MILALQLSHFSTAVIFSLCASLVFGITQRDTAEEMARYGAYCFMIFVLGLFAGGWAMWFLHH